MELFWKIYGRVFSEAVSAFNTDLANVGFRHEMFAWYAAATLGVLLVICFLIKTFKRGGSFYLHPGYEITWNERPWFLARLAFILPYVFLIAALPPLFIALADPFVIKENSKKITVIKSRERTDILDVSGSMGGSVKSKSGRELKALEAMAYFLIDFVKHRKDRKDRKDRNAFYTFGTDVFLERNFTYSHKAYLLSIFTTDLNKDTGSGTNIDRVLAAAIENFKENGIRGNKHRSILLMTDGVYSIDPIYKFKEMKENNIVPYMVFLESARASSGPGTAENKLARMISYVQDAGGRAFEISSSNFEDDLLNISKEFDKIETVNSEVKIINNKLQESIYQRYFVVSLLLFVAAFIMRIFTAPFAKLI